MYIQHTLDVLFKATVDSPVLSCRPGPEKSQHLCNSTQLLFIFNSFKSYNTSSLPRCFPTGSAFSTRAKKQTKLNWHQAMSLVCFSFTHSSLRDGAFLPTTRGIYQGEQTASLSPGPRAPAHVWQPHEQVSTCCRQNCQGNKITHCYRTDTSRAKPSYDLMLLPGSHQPVHCSG